ncbi:MAG: ankyrin repeat domain-containing protein [Vulcanimicrobiota bacterium]
MDTPVEKTNEKREKAEESSLHTENIDGLRAQMSDLNSLSDDIQSLLDEAVVKDHIDDRIISALNNLGKYSLFYLISIAGICALVVLLYVWAYMLMTDISTWMGQTTFMVFALAVFLIFASLAVIFFKIAFKASSTLFNFRKAVSKLAQEKKDRLISAMQAGNLERMKAIIDDDRALAELKDELGENLFHKAVSSGRKDIMHFLLERGFSVYEKNNSDRTPLHEASAKGYREMAEALISHGADITAKDLKGDTPLHLATRNGHKGVVELLISARAPVNIQNKTGENPLCCALSQQLNTSFAEIAVLLLENGADARMKRNDGATPLHIAAEQGYTKVARSLIAKEASVDAVDSSGWTPLHKAVQRGNIVIMELLLTNGAKVDAKTDIQATTVFGGWTALHFATNLGYMSAVELLINKGADINMRIDDRSKPYGGYRPLGIGLDAYAKRKGGSEAQVYKEIAELLVKHGGNE